MEEEDDGPEEVTNWTSRGEEEEAAGPADWEVFLVYFFVQKKRYKKKQNKANNIKVDLFHWEGGVALKMQTFKFSPVV